MDQKNLLLGHMEDLAKKAIRTGCATSRFLTPAEAHTVSIHFTRRNETTLVFDGGYEGAERVVAIFTNPNWGIYNRVDIFTALIVNAPSHETIGHRDVLGAIMALGIERNTIGDIIESPLSFLCLPELSGYIKENLIKIGRTGITLSEILLNDLTTRTENYTIKTDTVASPRLDAIVSSAFGMSRSKAVEIIESGRVNLNHEECLQPAKEVGENAIISIRGAGRVKLLEIGGTSRKGRLFIKVGLYGK